MKDMFHCRGFRVHERLTGLTDEEIYTEAVAAMNAWFQISREWELSCEQTRSLLGGPEIERYDAWREGQLTQEEVTLDLRGRLNDLIKIHELMGETQETGMFIPFLNAQTLGFLFLDETPLNYLLRFQRDGMAWLLYYLWMQTDEFCEVPL